MNFTQLNDWINTLKELDPEMLIFGSDFHHYKIHTPMTEEEISSLERKRDITLPSSYKEYLLLTNGGTGPGYGIYDFTTSLSKASKYGWEINQGSPISRDQYFFIDRTTPEDYGWLYSGSIPICSFENGEFCFLIVKGTRVGEVWRSSSKEIRFCSQSFSKWYQEWLTISLISGAVANIKNHFMVHGETDTIAYDFQEIRMYFERTYCDYDKLWMPNLLLPIGEISVTEGIGWLYLCEGEHKTAQRIFRSLYESHDESLKAAGGHGLWAGYILQGRIRDALKIGEVALELSRFCDDQERIYEIQYSLSITYAVLGKKELALRAAEELIDIYPSIEASFEILASLHIKFNSKKVAKKSITRLIRKHPDRKNHYSRKLWHIYNEAGAKDWSQWISRIIGSRDAKKMLQKIESKREKLKRIVSEKFGTISSFSTKRIDEINYIDELESLAQAAIDSDNLEEFEIKLLQYTR